MGRRKQVSQEPFEVDIDALNDNGTGAAVHDEKNLKVWGALPGERVEARLMRGRNFRNQAETLTVIRESADRQVAPCPSFGTCSACSLQHMTGLAQRDFKHQQLVHQLKETGGVEPQSWLEPLFADDWHYRRKARLSVRNVPAKGRVLVGFRERDGRFVTNMHECHTLHQRIAQLLVPLSDLIGQLEAVSSIPQIEVACGDDECAMVFRHLEALSEEDQNHLKSFAERHGLSVYLQPKGPETVHLLHDAGAELSYALPGFDLEMAFGPMDFVQVNAALNERMIVQALDLLEVDERHSVIDLFCGLGNFTLPLARHAAAVLGLEGADDLVTRAAQNARVNGVSNVKFAQADLYGENIQGSWPDQRFDRVLLDPPRSGAGPVLAKIAETGAERIVYVSCNPKTLAEDAGRLVHDFGYQLTAAGVMDMFPQTTHTESMALFEKIRGH